MLDGTWNLVYTSNSSLIGVLALGRLPLVTVGDVTQRIDVASNTVENQVGSKGRGASGRGLAWGTWVAHNRHATWSIHCAYVQPPRAVYKRAPAPPCPPQVALSGLLSKTKLTAVAQFEVLSSKRLGLKLERGQIQTPELTKDLELPDTLAVLGQSVDLSQVWPGIPFLFAARACTCTLGRRERLALRHCARPPAWCACS